MMIEVASSFPLPCLYVNLIYWLNGTVSVELNSYGCIVIDFNCVVLWLGWD